MKIKNIVWIFLAALAFASCSKDDGDGNIPQEPVDAVVSVATTAVSKRTKAGGNTIGLKEERIASLSAYVFKEGNQVGYRRITVADSDPSIAGIDNILIKIVPGPDGESTEEFTLILLANTDELKVNTLSELTSVTGLGGDLIGYKVGTSVLPMVSEPISFTGVKKSEKDAGGKYTTNNWVLETGGHVGNSKNDATEIPLTRMLARIEVNEVVVDLNKYPGATFALRTIALVNVRKGVDFSLKGIGDYVKGYQSAGYNYLPLNENGWWIPTTEVSREFTTMLEPALSQSYIFNAVHNNVAGDGYKFDDPISGSSVENPFFYRYIFPNSSKSEGAVYETGLVVGGIFTYQSGKTALKHFIVKFHDKQSSDISNQVLANTVYKVSITIQGEGSEDENHPQETVEISAKITVKGWELITQEEDL